MINVAFSVAFSFIIDVALNVFIHVFINRNIKVYTFLKRLLTAAIIATMQCAFKVCFCNPKLGPNFKAKISHWKRLLW